MAEQPRPKSPPGFTDFYSKRIQHSKLHLLETEIGFLQEELKSLESVPHTSRLCKEVNDYVAAKTDPFLAVNQNSRESDCFRKRVRTKSCFTSSWICCFSGCCQTDDDDACQQQVQQSCYCCPNCCSSQVCSCFRCSFKLTCSRNCLGKVKLCPSCIPKCCKFSGSCCC